ncbi:uncharacterized protein IL334_001287 [Kwoniella shivajii]|uniref:Uncharacterized protein n=1 Tax=Kwoniella shivajii TaxID=564305 RepID=A0ABZ1CT35_9TREE|nr:hypothetical protein IL334_001287 [Kwoniella shivajii]
MLLSLLAMQLLASTVCSSPTTYQRPFGVEQSTGDRVNVSLYVMSRCPDARLCENVFESVIQQDGILDKINLNIGYIGTPNKSESLGVSCKHGSLECIGNAHQLCLLNSDTVSIKKAYDIIQCQNYPSSFPKEIGTLQSIKECVRAERLDWYESGIGHCIEGKTKEENRRWDEMEMDFSFSRGPVVDDDDDDESTPKLGKRAKRLLLENIKQVYDKGIKTSCTIDIDSTIISHQGRRRCIVDGGVWKGCDDGHTPQDFVRVIEDEYENLKSQHNGNR